MINISILDDQMKILIDMVGQDINVLGTFYYDETNIFHKLKLTESGSNNDLIQQSFFALGGLHLKTDQSVNTENLLKSLKPQNSMKEFKYSYFSRKETNILKALNSDRFLILLKWIEENQIQIHFTLMDYLYYGISDIVDSLPNAADTGIFNRELKSSLYDTVRENLDVFLSLFYEFDYPNIDRDRRSEFINIFYDVYLDLMEYDNSDINDFPKEFLRQMIKSAKSANELVFLHDNEPFELFNEYAGLYIDRPIRFPKSNHVFDEVSQVKETLKAWDINFEAKLNLKFVDSKDLLLIQISDAIIGLISRVSNLVLNSDFDDLIKFISSLSDNQKKVLTYLYNGINRGVHKSIFFNQIIAPNSFLKKQQFLINILAAKV